MGNSASQLIIIHHLGRHTVTPISKINCVRNRVIVACHMASKECVLKSTQMATETFKEIIFQEVAIK